MSLISCECMDFEQPEFYCRSTVKARTPKKCCECGGEILPGEKYERVSAKWDGGVRRFCTCVDCVEAWAVAGCECRVHGELREFAEENTSFADDLGTQIVGMLKAIRKVRDENARVFGQNQGGLDAIRMP